MTPTPEQMVWVNGVRQVFGRKHTKVRSLRTARKDVLIEVSDPQGVWEWYITPWGKRLGPFRTNRIPGLDG